VNIFSNDILESQIMTSSQLGGALKCVHQITRNKKNTSIVLLLGNFRHNRLAHRLNRFNLIQKILISFFVL